MSFENLYESNDWDQDPWPVRAEWVALRMKTRSKQPKDIHSAANSAYGTRA